jgi:hypothetical protein
MMLLTMPASTSAGVAGRKRSDDGLCSGPLSLLLVLLLLPPKDTADMQQQQQQQ